jgi:small-conductance mechanosensitive channel
MPDRDSDGIVGQLFPKLGLGDRGNLFGYTVLLLLSVLVAFLAGKGRKRLPSRGVLPRVLSAVHIGMRTVVVLFGLALLAHWIPPSYAPVLLWVALAAAAAAGWSARDFLPDLFAGVVILVERRIRPGVWVSGSGYVGEVQSLGPRAAKLRDHEGRSLSVPNRKLLAGPVAVDDSLHPPVEVRLKVAEGMKAEEARQIIEDAALLSPWRVLLHRPEVFRDAQDPGTWRVRIRLIEPRFLAAFESALLDQVEESLRAPRLTTDS